MSELPVVILVHDAHGDVERAAERLRRAGLRNPMVHVQSLDELRAWQAHYPWEIAFLIVHVDACGTVGAGEAPPVLPAYPAFMVACIDGRLMASTCLSPEAKTTMPAPFDASALVRSLQKLGLRWLVL